MKKIAVEIVKDTLTTVPVLLARQDWVAVKLRYVDRRSMDIIDTGETIFLPSCMNPELLERVINDAAGVQAVPKKPRHMLDADDNLDLSDLESW